MALHFPNNKCTQIENRAGEVSDDDIGRHYPSQNGVATNGIVSFVSSKGMG